jgi:hypothetical protein
MKSYEEMSISCNTPTKYNKGLSAYFHEDRLYMTFGVRTYLSGIFEADITQGSVEFGNFVITLIYHLAVASAKVALMPVLTADRIDVI